MKLAAYHKWMLDTRWSMAVQHKLAAPPRRAASPMRVDGIGDAQP